VLVLMILVLKAHSATDRMTISEKNNAQYVLSHAIKSEISLLAACIATEWYKIHPERKGQFCKEL